MVRLLGSIGLYRTSMSSSFMFAIGSVKNWFSLLFSNEHVWSRILGNRHLYEQQYHTDSCKKLKLIPVSFPAFGLEFGLFQVSQMVFVNLSQVISLGPGRNIRPARFLGASFFNVASSTFDQISFPAYCI